jgi:hypothetical protein
VECVFLNYGSYFIFQYGWGTIFNNHSLVMGNILLNWEPNIEKKNILYVAYLILIGSVSKIIL